MRKYIGPVNRALDVITRARAFRVALVVFALCLFASVAKAVDPTVDDIVTGASTTFTAVAGVCVTMGVFFIGYKIARKIR